VVQRENTELVVVVVEVDEGDGIVADMMMMMMGWEGGR
jgi:hypothetical protein